MHLNNFDKFLFPSKLIGSFSKTFLPLSSIPLFLAGDSIAAIMSDEGSDTKITIRTKVRK